MVGCTRKLCKPHHMEQVLPLKGKEDSCDYKGKLYKKGDRFMDDCNHCFCGGNDKVGCTKMLCRPRHDGNILQADAADDSETCTDNGKVYKKGESFKKECNTCFCGGGNVIGCTLKMCQVHKPANSYKTTTCTHKEKTYNLGEHFMDECNKCFCGLNGHVGCTQMMCIPPKDLPYSDSETCTKDGKVYKKGDNFSLDGCNMCFCGGNNMIGCTKKLCPPKGCYHDGKLHKIGES
ncbi:hypothetical protein P5E99_15870, partial [Clostridium perfringens]|nr:hypothetical protein [Clostridium perfringens]